MALEETSERLLREITVEPSPPATSFGIRARAIGNNDVPRVRGGRAVGRNRIRG